MTDAEIRNLQAQHPTENDPMPFARAVESAVVNATPQQPEPGAQQDTARYRWLRDPCNPVHVAHYSRGDYGKGLFTDTMLDDAIDAEIREQK